MPRRLRLTHFSPWAEGLEPVSTYLARVPSLDLRSRVADAANPELLRMARLDCDWYGESTRAFAAVSHPNLEFLPAQVTGVEGLLALLTASTPAGVESWLVFDGQSPSKLAGLASKLLPLLRRAGYRLAWYGFDEVSRTCPAFKEFAPHLSVLIHDESPLEPSGAALLPKHCRVLHRSWVANVIPFSVPFNAAPEERILFLGSKLGFTEHRRRQIEFLQGTFGERLVAIHDHSVPVTERGSLNRFKVGLCPEGRKFTTPAMSQTHTDRPFWSGCLGLVPVSENSIAGDRLRPLAAEGLILSYNHGDLMQLKEACERALAAPVEQRRKIYDYFNQNETVGLVLAHALAGAEP